MTEAHERIVEDLAAYVLGSLETEEHLRVEAHVAMCPTCVGLVAEYRGVVGIMPIGLEPITPPESSWRVIRAGARRRRPGRSASLAVLPKWLRIARWPAVAALVTFLAVWNVTLQRELTRRAPGPAPGPEVEALSRRPRVERRARALNSRSAIAPAGLGGCRSPGSRCSAAMVRTSVSLPLKTKEELRAITNNPGIFERLVMMSCTNPSAK